MKRYLSFAFALLMLVCLLFGCGAKSEANDMGYVDSYAPEDALEEESLSSGSGTGSALPEGKKMVRKLWLDAETEDLDSLLSQVDQRITELNGYIEEREVRNGSPRSNRTYRYANITIRVPADKMDAFAAQVSENANVTSTNETAENITLSYVATESRVKALETEQSRLLELLAKAETMEDLLKIEKRLTDVRTELEEVTSQLRVYDNLVDYCTIYLALTEVKEYTPVEEPETIWQRMGEGFRESLESLGNFAEGLLIFLVCALPWLILPALILIVLLILHKRRRRSEKNTANEEKPQ